MRQALPGSILTTFESPFGKYRWLRLPFGLIVSSEIFQRHLLEALKGLKGIAIIADDILVYGCGDNDESATADHDRNLFALFERCRERGIRLNKDKFKLHQSTIAYMGHQLTAMDLKLIQLRLKQSK